MPAHTCSKRADIPALPAYTTQDGWVQPLGTKTMIPRLVEIRSKWLDLACGYSERATDPDCDHCERQRK